VKSTIILPENGGKLSADWCNAHQSRPTVNCCWFVVDGLFKSTIILPENGDKLSADWCNAHQSRPTAMG
jgi:hypothetical protein